MSGVGEKKVPAVRDKTIQKTLAKPLDKTGGRA